MGKTTVYADGVFDLFHVGHLSFLRQARALGDHLIVGVNNDAAVATYKEPPIIQHAHRVAMVEACRFVDQVVADAPLCVESVFLDQYQIDIVVHGDDTAYEEYYQVPRSLGIMRYVPYSTEISSTEIRSRVIARESGGDKSMRQRSRS